LLVGNKLKFVLFHLPAAFVVEFDFLKVLLKAGGQEKDQEQLNEMSVACRSETSYNNKASSFFFV